MQLSKCAVLLAAASLGLVACAAPTSLSDSAKGPEDAVSGPQASQSAGPGSTSVPSDLASPEAPEPELSKRQYLDLVETGLREQMTALSPAELAGTCAQWNLLGYGSDAAAALTDGSDDVWATLSAEERAFADDVGITRRDLVTLTVDVAEDICGTASIPDALQTRIDSAFDRVWSSTPVEQRPELCRYWEDNPRDTLDTLERQIREAARGDGTPTVDQQEVTSADSADLQAALAIAIGRNCAP